LTGVSRQTADGSIFGRRAAPRSLIAAITPRVEWDAFGDRALFAPLQISKRTER